jgi:arylsulfatase A-like enzyme
MPEYARPVPDAPASMPAFEDMYSAFDWGPLDLPDAETGDARSVQWIVERLHEEREEPFFLAAGIYRPHLPWYVPQRWFDLFPLESVQLPRLLENDLADVPERGRELARRGGDYHAHVVAAGQWRHAVQGYLASIAYADALVGQLLDALESSGHAEDTIVVLWSDHGWQLGEKQHWRKFALWENLARVVLMIRVPEGMPGLPGGAPAGSRSPRTVSLLDLYPTLIELAGAPERPGLDGRSLVPLLTDPLAAWDHPAITTYDFGEFSVRSERWHYIRYIDGSEELYDHATDPEEWTNLAGRPQYADVIAGLARHIPEQPAPLAETSYELAPHHIPPLRSVEDWRRLREGRPRPEH